MCRKFDKLSINDFYLSAEQLQNNTEENRNRVIAGILEKIFAITKDKAKTGKDHYLSRPRIGRKLLTKFIEAQPFKKTAHQEIAFWLQTVHFLREARVTIHNGEGEKIYARAQNSIQGAVVALILPASITLKLLLRIVTATSRKIK